MGLDLRYSIFSLPLIDNFNIAPNGFLGSAQLAVFLRYLKSGDFAKVVAITSKESDRTKQAVADFPGKVEVFALNYGDKAAMTAALQGVEVIVSAIGGNGEQTPLEQILIEAGTYAELTKFGMTIMF